jgi:hypothetical protein
VARKDSQRPICEVSRRECVRWSFCSLALLLLPLTPLFKFVHMQSHDGRAQVLWQLLAWLSSIFVKHPSLRCIPSSFAAIYCAFLSLLISDCRCFDASFDGEPFLQVLRPLVSAAQPFCQTVVILTTLSFFKSLVFVCFFFILIAGHERNAHTDFWCPIRASCRQALPRPHNFIFFLGRPCLASSLSGSNEYQHAALLIVTVFPIGVGCQPCHKGARFLAVMQAPLWAKCSHFEKVAETALVEIGPRLALQVCTEFSLSRNPDLT